MTKNDELQAVIDQGLWDELGHPRPAPRSGRAIDLLPADRRDLIRVAPPA